MCDVCNVYYKDDEFTNEVMENICNECFEDLVCDVCCGNCVIIVQRNAKGEVDYLNGQFTNEETECENCDGMGYILA